MKLKNLLAASAIMLASVIGTLSVGGWAFAEAFNADAYANSNGTNTNGCRPGTLYFEYHYKRVKNEDGSTTFAAQDADKQTGPAPKDAGDIKTANDCNLAKTDYELMNKSHTILDVVVGALGVVTVAVIVIGAIMYVTSQGDPAKTAKAKNAILFGIVGLLIAVLAYAVVNFVLNNVFG